MNIMTLLNASSSTPLDLMNAILSASATYQLCPDVLLFDLFCLLIRREIHLQCQGSWSVGPMSPVWLLVSRSFHNTNGRCCISVDHSRCVPSLHCPFLSEQTVLSFSPVNKESFTAAIPSQPSLNPALALLPFQNPVDPLLFFLSTDWWLHPLSVLQRMCHYPDDLLQAGCETLLPSLFLSRCWFLGAHFEGYHCKYAFSVVPCHQFWPKYLCISPPHIHLSANNILMMRVSAKRDYDYY